MHVCMGGLLKANVIALCVLGVPFPSTFNIFSYLPKKKLMSLHSLERSEVNFIPKHFLSQDFILCHFPLFIHGHIILTISSELLFLGGLGWKTLRIWTQERNWLWNYLQELVRL